MYRTAATYIHHGAPDLSDAPKEATLLSPEWLQPEVRPHRYSSIETFKVLMVWARN